MDRQGETAGDRRPEDDWWHDLYEEGEPDTGPPRVEGDTLDDRFASVSRTVWRPPVDEDAPEELPPAEGMPGDDDVADGVSDQAEPGADGQAIDRAAAEPADAVSVAEGPRADAGPADAPRADVPFADVPPADVPRVEPPPADVPPAEPPPVSGVPGFTVAVPRQAEPAEGELTDGVADDAADDGADDEGAGDGEAHGSPRTLRLTTIGRTDTLPGSGWEDRSAPGHIGGRPPTYEGEPTALPEAEPGRLPEVVPDTALDGARYGSFTLRTASTRGDSPRYRGEQRRDCLLTARFGDGDGALVFVAIATGTRGAPDAHRVASSLAQGIGDAVGRSRARLADDVRAGRRAALKAGLHRLTGRAYGRLRAQAEELGADPAAYTAGLRCLLLSADPECRTRVFFGTSGDGLFRLRDGEWQDLEPGPDEARADPRPTMDLGVRPAQQQDEADPVPFAFRASEGRTGDVLLLCSVGLGEPLRGEPALAGELARRWRPDGDAPPPGLAAFLSDVQLRAKGYADDRTAAAVWED